MGPVHSARILAVQPQSTWNTVVASVGQAMDSVDDWTAAEAQLESRHYGACVFSEIALASLRPAVVSWLRHRFPTVVLALVSDALDLPMYQRTLELGVDDAFRDPHQLDMNIGRLAALSQRRWSRQHRRTEGDMRWALLAEPTPDPRTEEQLRACGFGVRLASDAYTALELVRRQEIHVAFIDTDLTPLDGAATSEAIQRFDARVATIMLAREATVESAIRAMRHGAIDFIRRPIVAAELEAAAARVWSRRAHAPRSSNTPPISETPAKPDVLRVLIIEDHPGDARLAAGFLHSSTEGVFETTTVNRLRTAIDRASSETFDVALLDLGLPDSEGVDTFRRLREAIPDLPVVVVTDLESNQTAFETIEAGAMDYMLKRHMTPEALAPRVRYACERRRLVAQLEESHLNLEASQRRHHALLNQHPDAILVLDEGGVVVFANPAAEALFGRNLGSLLGSKLGDPGRSAAGAMMSIVRPDRETRVAETQVVETEWDGRPARLVSMRDMTERLATHANLTEMATKLRMSNRQLERLATIDPLTEVLNRRGLAAELERECNRARRSGGRLTVAVVDCDDFKSVNDAYGHAIGDHVLCGVAERLRETIRATDHLARVGGDEFLVLLPDTSVPEALRFAERLRRAIVTAPVALDPDPVHVTVSVGVAALDPRSATIEEALRSTREALHRSKTAGKNRVSHSDAS